MRLAKTINYINGIEYKNGNIEALYHEEGRFVYRNDLTLETNYHEIYVKDHLGNIRARVQDKDGNGEVLVDPENPNEDELIEQTHYYPFGMTWDGVWQDQDDVFENRYDYNGKEQVGNIGLLDYGARFYDPAIGRWTAIDPMAEYREGVSPYNYCQLNPISRIDPDGRFDTKFSARWHKWFHGGGDIVKTEDGWGVIQNKSEQVLEDGSVMIDYDLVKTRDQAAHSVSFAAGFSFGGGIGFELGMVYDQVGNVSPYGSFDANLGFSLYAGPNIKFIDPTNEDDTFRNKYWEGTDASTEMEVGPLGFSYGADIDDKANLFSPESKHYANAYRWHSVSPDPRKKEWKKWKNSGLGNALNFTDIRFQRSTSNTKLFFQDE